MAKIISLKWPATCSDCGAKLPAGAKARWYGKGHVYGTTCHARDEHSAPAVNGPVSDPIHEHGRAGFADPGGRSALRAASSRNPRVHPCPTCHRPNMLTAADVAQSYQCDRCADEAEGPSAGASYGYQDEPERGDDY
jgi:ribosomal protein L37AE/L43A